MAALPQLLPCLALGYAGGLIAADRGLPPDAAVVGLALALGVGTCLVRSARGRAGCAVAAAAAAAALSLGGALDDAARGPLVAATRRIEAEVESVRRGPGWTQVRLRDLAVAGPQAAPPRLELVESTERDPGLAHWLPGQRWRLEARLHPLEPRRNPGSTDSARRLARAGLGRRARPVDPALRVRLPEREGPRPLAALQRRRRAGVTRLEAAGPGGGLLAALAFGEGSALSVEARDAFARLGLAHLLAVSGLHLGLVAGLAYAGLHRLLARSAALASRRPVALPALGGALAAALGYALLAGFGVPVRRALALPALALLALARGHRVAALQAVALAALWVMVLEPGALFRAGPQLSFAAALALAVAWWRDGGTRRSAPARVLGSSATALAVTAPLAALHFGQSAPFALPANALALPWTALALLPAALGAGACAAWPAPWSGPVVAGAERLAAFTLAVVRAAGEALPGGSASAPPAAAAWIAATALGLAAVVSRRTEARVALAAAVCALLALAPPPSIAPAPPRIVALDVGQGAATLVQGRAGAVLLDAGGALPGGPSLGRRVVAPALAALGVTRLDLVAVSHADLDHRGGVPAILEAVPTARVWLPQGAEADPAFEAIRATARRTGARLEARGAGSPALRAGDLRVVPLWPPRGAAALDRNDRSLVLRVELAGRRLLAPGDLEARGEQALLARGADLRADVLLLGHHGSRSSSGAAWLAAVGAPVAIAAAPCHGRFAMPHPDVRARVARSGASLWWTGRDGAVLVGLAAAPAVVPWASARAGCAPPRPTRSVPTKASTSGRQTKRTGGGRTSASAIEAETG